MKAPNRKKTKLNKIYSFDYMLNKVVYQKQKNNKTNKSLLNIMNIINIIFIIFFVSFLNFSKCNRRNILSKISEITIKINGTGDINIFCDFFYFGEYEVYINDHLQNISKNIYNFENNINDVKIRTKDTLTSTSCMFYNCFNIIEINLSKFDSSQVTNTEEMFEGCYSLISLDLTNFNTSQVNSMMGMFYECHH